MLESTAAVPGLSTPNTTSGMEKELYLVQPTTPTLGDQKLSEFSLP